MAKLFSFKPRVGANPLFDPLRELTIPTASLLGMYEGYRKAEEAIHQIDREVTFEGTPPAAANHANTQTAQGYVEPRPPFLDEQNVVVDEEGMVWKGRALIRRYSARRPGPKDFLRHLKTGVATKEINEGTLIETAWPNTYGDWYAGLLRYIVAVPREDIRGPIVLNRELAGRSYVKRDLDALGIPLLSSECGVQIKNARILRMLDPHYEFHEQDVENFRKAFSIAPPQPIPGSLIYLARYDFKSEAVDRTYPSELMAEIIKARGGIVVDTRECSPQKFDELAPYAETLVADQGSAMFGVMHWRTKRALELSRDNWWNSANVFMAKATGVERYRIAVIDNADRAFLEAELDALMQG